MMNTPNIKFSKFLLDNFLDNKRDGFFIEAGAMDGYKGSVCYHLEKEYNWSGMNIEANPYCFKSIKEKRPNCINIFSGIWSEDTIKSLVTRKDKPIAGSASIVKIPLQKGKPWRENNRLFEEVSVRKLSDIVKENEIKHIDLIVLDVEGAEVEVLKDLSNSNIRPEVMCVEYDKVDSKRLKNLTEDMGYKVSVKKFKNNKVYTKV